MTMKLIGCALQIAISQTREPTDNHSSLFIPVFSGEAINIIEWWVSLKIYDLHIIIFAEGGGSFPIFITDNSQPMSPKTVWHSWCKMLKLYGTSR